MSNQFVTLVIFTILASCATSKEGVFFEYKKAMSREQLGSAVNVDKGVEQKNGLREFANQREEQKDRAYDNVVGVKAVVTNQPKQVEYLPTITDPTPEQLANYDPNVYVKASSGGKPILIDKRRTNSDAIRQNYQRVVIGGEKPSDGLPKYIFNPTPEQLANYDRKVYMIGQSEGKPVLIKIDRSQPTEQPKVQIDTKSPVKGVVSPDQSPKGVVKKPSFDLQELAGLIKGNEFTPPQVADNSKKNPPRQIEPETKKQPVVMPKKEVGTGGLPTVIKEFDPNNYDKEHYMIGMDQQGKPILIIKTLVEATLKSMPNEQDVLNAMFPGLNGDKGGKKPPERIPDTKEVAGKTVPPEKKAEEASKDKKLQPSPNVKLPTSLQEIYSQQLAVQAVAGGRKKKEGARNIVVHFDDTYLRFTLKQLNRMDAFEPIRNLITKADAYLKTYISMTKPLPTITVPRFYQSCATGNPAFGLDLDYSRFPRALEVKADMIIFLYAFNNPARQTLAAAYPCEADRQKPPKIAVINFNLHNMLNPAEFGNMRALLSELNTVVHEIFHVLGFHNIIMKDFRNELSQRFPNLLQFKNSPHDPMRTNDHWSNEYFSFDIMGYADREGAVATVFSMEYLELAHPGLLAQRENLARNEMEVFVKDWKDFVNYRCGATEKKSKYPNWCTPTEAVNKGELSCSKNRLYRMQCHDQLFDNNCHERLPYYFGLCTDKSRQIKTNKGEYFGEDSRCFELTSGQGSGCLRFSIENGELVVFGENERVVCKEEGQEHTLYYEFKPGMKAVRRLKCPSPAEFIQELVHSTCPNSCWVNGLCIEGRCHCFEGYDEDDHCKSRKKDSESPNFVTSFPVPSA